ncbi:uncharacterized protein LOC143021635 [Oratosquilla oratoria]|uniref:uncharacterized protein LOC143021635 n=1 Tax=Oratosquilla oratoria TaxID=337810 RepID=UPI003F75F293
MALGVEGWWPLASHSATDKLEYMTTRSALWPSDIRKRTQVSICISSHPTANLQLWNMKGVLFVVALLLGTAMGWTTVVKPTVAKVWPKPQMEQTQETFMVVRPSTFKFSVTGHTCDILTEAVKRYSLMLFDDKKSSQNQVSVCVCV